LLYCHGIVVSGRERIPIRSCGVLLLLLSDKKIARRILTMITMLTKTAPRKNVIFIAI